MLSSTSAVSVPGQHANTLVQSAFSTELVKATNTLTETVTSTSTSTATVGADLVMADTATCLPSATSSTSELATTLLQNATSIYTSVQDVVKNSGIVDSSLNQHAPVLKWVVASIVLGGGTWKLAHYITRRQQAPPPMPIPAGNNAKTWKARTKLLMFMLKKSVGIHIGKRENLKAQNRELEQTIEKLLNENKELKAKLAETQSKSPSENNPATLKRKRDDSSTVDGSKFKRPYLELSSNDFKSHLSIPAPPTSTNCPATPFEPSSSAHPPQSTTSLNSQERFLSPYELTPTRRDGTPRPARHYEINNILKHHLQPITDVNKPWTQQRREVERVADAIQEDYLESLPSRSRQTLDFDNIPRLVPTVGLGQGRMPPLPVRETSVEKHNKNDGDEEVEEEGDEMDVASELSSPSIVEQDDDDDQADAEEEDNNDEDDEEDEDDDEMDIVPELPRNSLPPGRRTRRAISVSSRESVTPSRRSSPRKAAPEAGSLNLNAMSRKSTRSASPGKN